jgi:hypothetical protein
MRKCCNGRKGWMASSLSTSPSMAASRISIEER